MQNEFTAENTEENHAKNTEKCIRFIFCDSLRFPLRLCG